MNPAFIVEFTLRDEDGYAYETDVENVCFASDKEAWDFYDTLPAYVEKHYPHQNLENRYPPKCVGAVFHYDKENLELS